MLRIFLALLVSAVGVSAKADECGKPEVTPRSGQLISHLQYGKCTYQPNMQCVWNLVANPEDEYSRLRFTFDSYEMPKEAQPCRDNFLRAFPDKDGKQPAFKNLCEGRQLPETFDSTTNTIRLVFNASGIGARGFVLKWKLFRVCRPTDFKCASGDCIDSKFRCDGGKGLIAECTDGSDEAGCKEVTCTAPNQARCDHKLRCYPSKAKCNGKNDCRDGSDEKGCTVATCDPATEQHCAHKFACFKTTHRCDGVEDCNDGSDEKDCKPATCTKMQFKCGHGFSCIERQSLCDGKKDCRDNSDETGCKKCAAKGDYRCLNKNCVGASKHCDGNDDCGDGSDELGCAKSCSIGQFKCGLPRCVDTAVQCNFVDDCGDGTDEKDCPYKQPGLEGLPCLLNHVFCRQKKRCIKASLACNGVDDCGDNSDEENCAKDLCKAQWHQCANSQYIAKAKKCDGTPHCADKSDEKSCSSTG